VPKKKEEEKPAPGRREKILKTLTGRRTGKWSDIEKRFKTLTTPAESQEKEDPFWGSAYDRKGR
jgi:hypothetical protein